MSDEVPITPDAIARHIEAVTRSVVDETRARWKREAQARREEIIDLERMWNRG